VIVPNHPYTHAELKALRADPELKAWSAKGYHWQQNLDGTVQLTHWSKVPGTAGTPMRGYVGTFDEDPWKLDPIRKRTRMERVDSLMLRFIEDCKKTGTVPGLSDAKVSEIVGEAWVTGRNEVTAEVVRSVAAHFLNEAAKQNA
jgi:hypothetical protein